MFFPLSQHFSSSSFFSTTWILSQQRISTLSCLLAILLLLLWYDCYVFVCVSLCVWFFFVHYECEFCSPHCSLLQFTWEMVRLLLAISPSFFYNAAVFVYFRLLRMQKNVIPFFWFCFFFKFTFDTIFKFDLTFFCLGFCSGWWRSLWKRLTFNRNWWVCVSEFVCFVCGCMCQLLPRYTGEIYERVFFC